MSPKSAPCGGRAQDMQDAKPDFGVSADDLANLLEVNLTGRGVEGSLSAYCGSIVCGRYIVHAASERALQ